MARQVKKISESSEDSKIQEGEATTIQEVLNERGKVHGDFAWNAYYSQTFKNLIKNSPNYNEFSYTQKEALDAICGKISRILSGNPDHPDHWRDISGYAELEFQQLMKEMQ